MPAAHAPWLEVVQLRDAHSSPVKQGASPAPMPLKASRHDWKLKADESVSEQVCASIAELQKQIELFCCEIDRRSVERDFSFLHIDDQRTEIEKRRHVR